MTDITLPEGFVLGAATSAYQIEGAWDRDGKGASIWDVFTQTPGRTAGDVPGDRGTDHYDRWREDVAEMKALGLDSYRFSLSWSRLLPRGTGPVNEAGVAFYDGLIDALIEAGIEPNVTLYHWDLPQALQERGGWGNREIIEWFAEYARLAFERFGDRVTRWATINEPIALWVGYGLGIFAPGLKIPSLGKQAMHHAMLAHGRAVREFRSSGSIGEIGIVIDVWKRHAATDSPADHALAQRDEDDSFRFFFDELFRGGWSDRLRARLEADGTIPGVMDGDFSLAGERVDYVGMNLYSRVVVSAENYNPAWWEVEGTDRTPGGNYLTTGQELYPQVLREAARVLRHEYGVTVPLYVTENGFSNRCDAVTDGRVEDPERIRYVSAFLREAMKANAEGLDIRGYYLWSLMDNYEWSAAYTERYGILHVDLETMRRTWKDSAYWFAELCRTRVIPSDEGSGT